MVRENHEIADEMPEGQAPRVSALYRYPVKGLSPEPLDSVTLAAGETLPFDRAYAIENGPGRFDPARAAPSAEGQLPDADARRAARHAAGPASTMQTRTLTIFRDGKQVARGQLDTPLGRQLIEQFIAAYMKAELRGAPKIVHARRATASPTWPPSACTSSTWRACASWSALSAGQVDPLRFRANRLSRGADAVGRAWLARQGDAASARPRLAVFARTHALRGDQRRSADRRARHGDPGHAAAHLGPPGLRHLREGHNGWRDWHRHARGLPLPD